MHNRPYKLLLILISIIFSSIKLTYGQKQNEYRGTILSSDSTLLLRGINIINLNSKAHTLSDAYGNFVLNINIGDTIEFRHDHWETKLIQGDKLKDSIILNKKSIVLDEIVITRNRHNKEIGDLKAIQKEKNKKGGIYYGGRPPIALLNPFGGKPITFFYELLSKSGRRARKMEKNIEDVEKESKVDSIFNINSIKSVIPIKEDEIIEFMEKYRPNVDQIQSWNTYDLYLYLQESYKSFKKQ
ncbi:hypothetical protein HX021_03720 [Sphingobacterium sp. N143]|uniref:hypothetical protein n=1 Tax=Sphingobacterium sp. N143 TaxID=2746727 RepID=UPI002576E6F5|nr:hypothetical protein [Sphingobacterium sp. N143]MDM1293400.1 hypothetical protein [Sphingobacterium sp. N143]